jgi:DNA-binding IclR family transcriptional regulator
MARNAVTDLQMIMLITASRRTGGNLLPWPRSLASHGDAIPKAVASLLRRRLIEEVEVKERSHARRSTGKTHFGLAVTEAGRLLAAAEEGAERDTPAAEFGQPGADDSMTVGAAPPTVEPAAADMANIRAGTKQALLVDLLKGDPGASLADLAAATDWLPHTVRAALTGLRKRGFTIISEKVDGGTRYRIASVAHSS